MKVILNQPKYLAGADIEEMSNKTFLECHNENFLSVWDSMFRNLRKPIIAAVNGYAVIISISSARSPSNLFSWEADVSWP